MKTERSSDTDLVTDGGQDARTYRRRLGPHYVPKIECEKCGTKHHIDAAAGEYQDRCVECSAFLRRPTDAEERQFHDFILWKDRHRRGGEANAR